MKTAILLSGTAYNFRYSIKSIMDNLIIPNDADVFILTSRYNSDRKTPEGEIVSAESPKEWYEKSLGIIRGETDGLSEEDINFIKSVFGQSLKSINIIEDMPEYMSYLENERVNMMNTVNLYRRTTSLNPPFGGDVTGTDNGNIRCVVDQYNHIKKCYEIMEQYSLLNNIEYNYVARVRIDFVVPEKFDFSWYYLNHDHPYLYSCGSFRGDIVEWADEFCFFARKETAKKVFSNLNLMGFIVNDKYNTFHKEQNNDYTFAAETQFSLLLYELNVKVVNLKIYRSACYTNGGDGFDYLNYMFRWDKVNLENEYKLVCESVSDINEHLPILKQYGDECTHITELGTRFGNSTVAFMMSRPDRFVSYDIHHNNKIDYLKRIADECEVNFEFKMQNPTDIEETDLLFIDTYHNVEQCSLELTLHSPKVKKYIIFHDTVTFWEKGQGHEQGGGLKYAIEPFMILHPEWVEDYRSENNNGLLILKKNI